MIVNFSSDEKGGYSAYPCVLPYVLVTAKIIARHLVGYDHVLRFALDPDCTKFVSHNRIVALYGTSLTVSPLTVNAIP